MPITRSLCWKFWVSKWKLEAQETVLTRLLPPSPCPPTPPGDSCSREVWEIWLWSRASQSWRCSPTAQGLVTCRFWSRRSGLRWDPTSRVILMLLAHGHVWRSQVVDTRVRAPRCVLSSTPVALRITTSSAAAYHSYRGFSKKQTQTVHLSGKARMPPFDSSTYFL